MEVLNVDSSKAPIAAPAGATANLVAATVAAVSLTLIVAAAVLVLAKDRSPAGGFDLQRLPAQTRHAYGVAVDHHDLFAHLPCYCGCALLASPHESLADCFVDSSGSFVTHASSCGTCVDIALEAERANEQGLDHGQIRALVDELFAGRGPGTATNYP